MNQRCLRVQTLEALVPAGNTLLILAGDLPRQPIESAAQSQSKDRPGAPDLPLASVFLIRPTLLPSVFRTTVADSTE
jgi:hypothetical protein